MRPVSKMVSYYLDCSWNVPGVLSTNEYLFSRLYLVKEFAEASSL